MIYFYVLEKQYQTKGSNQRFCEPEIPYFDMLQAWVEELKQNLTTGWWAQLLAVYCTKGNLEGAKECLDQIKATNQELVELDATKVIKAVKLFIENNQLDGKPSLLRLNKLTSTIVCNRILPVFLLKILVMCEKL